MCVVHGGRGCGATSARARVWAYSALVRGFKVFLSSWLTVSVDSSLSLRFEICRVDTAVSSSLNVLVTPYTRELRDCLL